ncbi:TRAP transporter small permease subunit [Neptunicoccus cionae]|uniref:TRAP transporter small permease subunit n=1 Tax=Neptunicoccus cionae TaxID=2035344 RepID=UPI000C7876A8|nr:TRAP transporter small permease subunit [Amylibacter cionae]PLS20642.1 permease [Amylibacter cionae]
MADAEQPVVLRKYGTPAPLVRIIGWTVLACLAAFLINNILNVGFGYARVMDFIQGQGGALAVGMYAAFIACAVIFVLMTKDVALRWDADRIHRFNLYIIRVCFWSVLLVGIADSLIAILRVEKGLDFFFSEDTVRSLGLSRYVGSYVHLPLIGLSFIIALFTRTLGFTWLTLMIVASELLIVISRFVFSYEQALMGDLVRYWYAALFLFASAYTLYEEGHVRVDVLYAGFTDRTRGFVNAFGSLFLGAATAWVILYIGLNGKQSIINAPLMNFEITQTGGVGMFVKYQMAGFLGMFAITMLIQFVSYFFEAVADYRSEPGKRELAPVAH